MGEKLGGTVLSNSFLGGRKASFPSLFLSPPPLLGKTHASGQDLWCHQEGVPGDWGSKLACPLMFLSGWDVWASAPTFSPVCILSFPQCIE